MHESNRGSNDVDVDSRYAALLKMSHMLRDYFRISINTDGQLTSLPELLHGYTPLAEELPAFLWRLSEVSCDDERKCFDEIANVLGAFYSALPYELDASTAHESSNASLQYEERRLGIKGEETLLQVFMPAVKQLLIAPKDLEEMGFLHTLASLEQLYKVFERC
jgi:DNA mismatch repair protein MLH1